MIVTEEARKKIDLLVAEDDTAAALRISIVGGGCSGFNYGFSFTDKIEEGDLVFGHVVVDPVSYQYLDGATIDYKKEIMGEQFTISNPNAATTCGCGSSFSV